MIRSSFLTVAWFVASGLVADNAHAQSASRMCAEAASAGQVLRDEGKLVDARAKFVTCAQPTCPKLIQKDCAQWQTEVDGRLPTIVLAAKDSAGRDVKRVTVTMDGKPLATGIDGRSVAVDPGAHKFRFEAEGFEATETEAVVREGERARAIQGTLKLPPGSEPLPPVVKPPEEPDAKGPGPLPWILGGIGIVGLGAGTAFYFMGKSELDDLYAGCNNTPQKCSDADKAPVETKRTLEIVSYAVGGAALAGAIILFATSGSGKSSRVTATAVPMAQGARATVQFRF